jgi:hypothetical protein
MLMTSESSDHVWRQNGGEGYTSLGCPCTLVGKTVEENTNVDAKVAFVSSSPDAHVFLMRKLYSH